MYLLVVFAEDGATERRFESLRSLLKEKLWLEKKGLICVWRLVVDQVM